MIEIAFVMAIVVGLALALERLRRRRQDAFTLESDVDLPCPWCRAQTREDDTSCPSCHQEFGIVSR